VEAHKVVHVALSGAELTELGRPGESALRNVVSK
jgi:hypothetical protein